MTRAILAFYILLGMIGCSKEKPLEEYPVIDIVNDVGKYQRLYCSDYFSSIEVIPLETMDDCLVGSHYLDKIVVNDDLIFLQEEGRLYAFDRSGKFHAQIGERGQGVGEYQILFDIFTNTDRSAVYVSDYTRILEYDFEGRFIRAFRRPEIDDLPFSGFSYVGDELFIGHISYGRNSKYKYGLFDHNGDSVKGFPSHIFVNRDVGWAGAYDGALNPVRVDDRLYLKDYVNDTIYQLDRTKKLQAAYVFGLGKYIYPIEYMETLNMQEPFPTNAFIINNLVGMPNYFFYQFRFPNSLSRPKVKPKYNPILNEYRADERVYGLYNIEQQTNILLDTDPFLQKGFINDINGGLSFIPRYYAGDGIVVDFWTAEEMKEMLTDEYFASQKISDPQGHQKLKELLCVLNEDDNPVIVVAQLKK